MKKMLKTSHGITLLALIVTVIVLLILAGITIATLTGPNSIIIKANKAKEEMKKAQYLEELQVIGLGLQPDRVRQKWDNQTYMNRYQEEIEDDDMFLDAKEIKQLPNTEEITIQVTTVENWVYWITEEKVVFKGQKGENIPPDLNTDTPTQIGNVKFKYMPSKWTNGKVTVEITTSIKDYKLQYSIGDNMTWKNYNGAIEVENNGTAIHARLINDLGEAGNYATANIENIDRLKPKAFIPEVVETTDTTITIRGTTVDQEKTTIDGCSGIESYYFSIDNGVTWVPEQGQKEEQYTFNNLEAEVIYNLKMKAVDKAENEIITQTIEQETELKPTGIYASLVGNTLKFYTTQEGAEASSGKVYENVQGKTFTRDNTDNVEAPNTPWFADADKITAVEFVDEVAPEYMAYYFSDLKSLQTVNMEKVKTINVNNMYGMFLNCESLREINTKGFDTRNVENMGWMFLNCKSLTNLDVTGFDTSKVTNMEVMFNGCSSLTRLDVSSFDTSNVTTMRSMFANCSNLTSIDVSNFNTSNVTNMATMFYNSNKLNTLDVSNFDTSNVTTMYAMFSNCTKLTQINVSNFNTSKVVNMDAMFNECRDLQNINVLNFDTSNVTSMRGMFYGCSTLKSLDLSSFDTKKVTNMARMFSHSSNLGTIYVGKNWVLASERTEIFYSCKTSTTTLKQN